MFGEVFKFTYLDTMSNLSSKFSIKSILFIDSLDTLSNLTILVIYNILVIGRISIFSIITYQTKLFHCCKMPLGSFIPNFKMI